MEVEMKLKQATSELLLREPEWAPIFIRLVQISQESPEGELDGSAVRNRAQRAGWTLVPLRTLGILEKSEPARKKGTIVHARLPGDFFDRHRQWMRHGGRH